MLWSIRCFVEVNIMVYEVFCGGKSCDLWGVLLR